MSPCPRFSRYHWRRLKAELWPRLLLLFFFLYISLQLGRIALSDYGRYRADVKAARYDHLAQCHDAHHQRHHEQHGPVVNSTVYLCRYCSGEHQHGQHVLSTCRDCRRYVEPPPPFTAIALSNDTMRYIQHTAFRAFFNDSYSPVGYFFHCHEPQEWCEPFFPLYRDALLHPIITGLLALFILVMTLALLFYTFVSRIYDAGNGDEMAAMKGLEPPHLQHPHAQ